MIVSPVIALVKSSVPIIWLDTSIIFYMTRWKLGKKIDTAQRERVSFLYDSIYYLTRNKKLICPLADQREEMWKGRADCLQIMLELSLGIKTIYSELVKEYQTRQFMDAFINKREQVEIKYLDYFHRDPYKQLSDNSRIIVSVDLGLIEKPDEIKKRRLNQKNKLENIRKSIMQTGILYEEQLEKEFKSELDTIAYLLNKSLQDEFPVSNFFAISDLLSKYLEYWTQLNGKVDDLITFFNSSYYRKIPFHNISCQMWAKILTQNDPIKSGHIMDIDYASSAIPYVNLFITDKYMKKIICDLELDKSYKSMVLNISELGKVEKYFKDL